MARRFDRDFRRLVAPRIKRMIRMHGTIVALDLERFTQAYYDIMHFAASRGALHLSPELFHELEEWIECALADAIDAELGEM